MSEDAAAASAGARFQVSAGDDPHTLLDGLVEGVGRALGPGVASSVLVVDRSRSLGDRMAGRPGRVTSLKLTTDRDAMTLALDGSRLAAETAVVSGGIVISRKKPPLGEWLNAFAGRIASVAADAAGDAAAATQALVVLGIQPASAGLEVDERDIDGGLQRLEAAVRTRIPADALVAVTRIRGLLVDTLPRVGGDVESSTVVTRTATSYLPDTLRAYLALPADWASSRVLSNGSTAAQSLTAQLDALETAATRMHDAAVEQDASALLTNGRFLADRFATGLELRPPGA